MSTQAVLKEAEAFIYRCIKCGVYWTMSEDTPENIREMIERDQVDISSGYCPECLRGQAVSKIRKSQKQNGYPTCYLKAEDFCDQLKCCYRSSCLEEEVEKWRQQVVLRKSYTEDRRNS